MDGAKGNPSRDELSLTASKSPESLGQWALTHFSVELHRYLMRQLRNEQNAQDVAQEVYLRLLRVTATDQVRNYQAYLFSVASNVIKEFKVRAHRNQLTYDSEMVDALADIQPQEGSAGSSGEVDARLQLEAVLAQLPPLCRSVLMLQKQEGMTYAQIAEELGISVPMVHRNIIRTLALLRKVKW